MKLPIPEQPTTANSPTGPVLVRAYQIVVPVNLVIGGMRSPRFPAILDIGHSHNFSIRKEQVVNWVGASPKPKGFIRVYRLPMPMSIWTAPYLDAPKGLPSIRPTILERRAFHCWDYESL